MSRIAYVDGRYLPHAQAQVSIDDRGYQFADGVYEVVTVRQARLIEEDGHLQRLNRSLTELRIARPMNMQPMRLIMREVLRRNRIVNGLLYMQVTRGVAPRDHKFPGAGRSVLVMTARPLRPVPDEQLTQGVEVILIPDIRWRRCDIKSTSLLANVLGKQQAVEAGAYEAWMIDDAARITEGTASNAWIVTAEGRIVTRDLGEEILSGITRLTVLKLAAEAQLTVEQRAFSVDEAKEAAEAFLTSASSFVIPVTRIDGTQVGNGRPGDVTLRLRQAYEAFMAKSPRFRSPLLDLSCE